MGLLLRESQIAPRFVLTQCKKPDATRNRVSLLTLDDILVVSLVARELCFFQTATYQFEAWDGKAGGPFRHLSCAVDGRPQRDEADRHRQFPGGHL
jgi:hypothetical protein